MKERDKNIVFSLIIMAITLFVILYSVDLYFENSELREQVERRDKTINDLISDDSLYNLKTKNFADTITKIFNDCSFIIDGKKVSPDEFIKLFQDYLTICDSISLNRVKQVDSIWRQRDSTLRALSNKNASHILKRLEISQDSLLLTTSILRDIKNTYGISYNVVTRNNRYYYKPMPSRADSAIILYPYYKRYLTYDSIKNRYNIQIVKPLDEYLVVPEKKKKKKKN